MHINTQKHMHINRREHTHKHTGTHATSYMLACSYSLKALHMQKTYTSMGAASCAAYSVLASTLIFFGWSILGNQLEYLRSVASTLYQCEK